MQNKTLKEIKKILGDGVRSPGWDLSGNVERAVKDGHPQPEFLRKLAKVVSDEADIKSLNR